jgi:Pvc16 N-terminal domain
MIDRAVNLVAQRLNAHLRARFGVADDIVAVSSLTDAEGKTPAGVRNRLALFVTNITHDTMSRGVVGRAPMIAGRVAVSPVPVHLNVHLMLAGCYDPENYLESLKILSHAIQFFQVNPVFDRLTAPDMDRSLEQLSFEIENLDTDAASQLWGILGGRYLPSVQYRMRTVTIDAGALTAEALVIRAPDSRAAAEAGA